MIVIEEFEKGYYVLSKVCALIDATLNSNPTVFKLACRLSMSLMWKELIAPHEKDRYDNEKKHIAQLSEPINLPVIND